MFISIAIVGCGGREAYPIECVRHYDKDMSCESIVDEMKELEGKISKLGTKSSKTGRNVACAAGAVLFLPALCFMDLKNAEKTELEAYQSRYNHLSRLYRDKSCGTGKCKTKK